jgi:hypothetical protein
MLTVSAQELPLLDATKLQYNIMPTLAAFAAQAANFGTFPQPTEDTVLAAETLIACLQQNNAPNAGAICIAELRSARGVRFIAVASGGGIIPNNVHGAWQAMLAPLLQGFFQTVQCDVLDTAAIFYSPLHADTVQFIQQGFPGFALPAMPLDTPELQQAVQNLNALPTGPFGVNYQNSLPLPNLAPTTTALHETLAVAVALRINAFNRANVANARDEIDQLRNRQQRHFPYAGREELIENLEALALLGQGGNLFPYSEDPQKPISNVRAVQAKLTNAWRVADLNRFCAEPKMFTYIKAYGLRDPVAGQLALWWDTVRPNRYAIAGAPFYMLPCTSCQARSAEMMLGITRANLAAATAEAPVNRMNVATPQRGRSASFSG